MASKKLSQKADRVVPKSKPVQKDPAHSSTLSAEFVEESSDEDNELDGKRAPAAETTRSKKYQEALSSAATSEARGDDSGDDDEDVVDTVARSSDNDEGREASSDHESIEDVYQDGSDPDSEQDDATDNESVANGRSGSTPRPLQDKKLITSRTAFRPPRGFTLTTIPQGDSMQSVLSTESLTGKQLWHIVAPAELPVGSISTGRVIRNDIDGAQTERLDDSMVAATHKGTDYLLLEDDSQESPQWVYVPKAGQSTFAPTKMKIARNVRLRQDPSAKQGPSSSGTGSVIGSGRPAPEQPAGLRMRYQPFGVATSDHLSRVHPSTRPMQAPTDPVPRSNEKRKARPSTHGETPDNPSKKHKKRHKEALAGNGVEHINGTKQEEASHKTSNSKPVKSHPELEPTIHRDETEEDPDGTVANQVNEVGVSETPEERAKRKADEKSLRRETETPEERAKRRAEKKRRKEERAAQRAG